MCLQAKQVEFSEDDSQKLKVDSRGNLNTSAQINAAQTDAIEANFTDWRQAKIPEGFQH